MTLRKGASAWSPGYLCSIRRGLRTVLDFAVALSILALVALIAARFEMATLTLHKGSARIIDGDSLVVGGQRIRLLGIDAPELSQTCTVEGRSYECGRESQRALTQLTQGASITCKGRQRDKYGRLLANCVANGLNLSMSQVEAGWAVAYGDFADEEREARDSQVGLWRGKFDNPRDWRAQHGGMVEPAHDSLSLFGDWLWRLVGFKGDEHEAL